MEILRYAPSLHTLIQTASGQFFVVFFAYVLMAVYIYKMFHEISIIKKNMDKYKSDTDDAIKNVLN